MDPIQEEERCIWGRGISPPGGDCWNADPFQEEEPMDWEESHLLKVHSHLNPNHHERCEVPGLLQGALFQPSN
ncbi:hypothetical protein NPIL_180091 [Nephila pilipes]|uniref:Uncharacterized protein n=1 Tax=Nephila pilipes TaxID=299642 RepID=A0A8X6U9V9_NEPPI|nr:hypothetical protein NPIL_180091 [Nephila pilipes]